MQFDVLHVNSMMKRLPDRNIFTVIKLLHPTLNLKIVCNTDEEDYFNNTILKTDEENLFDPSN